MPEMETTIIVVGDTRTCNVYGSPKDAKIIFDKHVTMPMRDGVELMSNVFRPEGDEKYPAILCFAPYGKDSYPPDAQFARIPNVGALPFGRIFTYRCALQAGRARLSPMR